MKQNSGWISGCGLNDAGIFIELRYLSGQISGLCRKFSLNPAWNFSPGSGKIWVRSNKAHEIERFL
jgi:hypothetical protein